MATSGLQGSKGECPTGNSGGCIFFYYRGLEVTQRHFSWSHKPAQISGKGQRHSLLWEEWHSHIGKRACVIEGYFCSHLWKMQFSSILFHGFSPYAQLNGSILQNLSTHVPWTTLFISMALTLLYMLAPPSIADLEAALIASPGFLKMPQIQVQSSLSSSLPKSASFPVLPMGFVTPPNF